MLTYKAINTKNGRFYVGSTNNFERRKKQHLESDLNYPFQNALRKDPGAFEWEVYEDDSEEPVLEQALLDMWYGTEQCYNLNPSASVPPSWEGREHKDETIERMSEARREWWAKATEEMIKPHSERMSEVNRNLSKEQRLLVGQRNADRAGKTYIFIAPDGQEVTVNNVRKFVRDNDLNRSCVKDMLKGKQKQHRGWRVKLT